MPSEAWFVTPMVNWANTVRVCASTKNQMPNHDPSTAVIGAAVSALTLSRRRTPPLPAARRPVVDNVLHRSTGIGDGRRHPAGPSPARRSAVVQPSP